MGLESLKKEQRKEQHEVGREGGDPYYWTLRSKSHQAIKKDGYEPMQQAEN